mmetsp:Transcript_49838/g.93421  ORF Transcript_49838/g.93421 Transcript_49838/m.93421 type:complete len:200 (+) Transcript_49838:88-687(+)
MAFQRSVSRLQASPHWPLLEKFKEDGTKLELKFGNRVTSTAREDIRQICKHFGLNFRCIGAGVQKHIVALKFDAIRERARAEEVAQKAPKPVEAFYKAVLGLIPEKDHILVNALFVKHYAGEKAWSLGEERLAPEALALPRRAREEESAAPPRKKIRHDAGPPEERKEDSDAEAPSSDSDDVEALLGRWSAVSQDAGSV